MCIRFDPCPLDELWGFPHWVPPAWEESDEQMEEEEAWEEGSTDEDGFCWCGARCDPTFECLCGIADVD